MGRIDKVNQQLKREIARIMLQELSDPRLEFVSITAVSTSKDLKNARVYYSVLGNEQKQGEVQKGLDRARGMIRRLLSSELNMRNTPELRFIFDNSLESSARIEETLKEINEESE